LRKFDYIEPKTLGEVISALQEYGTSARVLAGGTNLVPAMKDGAITPKYIVNLKTVEGLNELHEDKKGVHIGALVPLAELARTPCPPAAQGGGIGGRTRSLAAA
jgi:CO/xanthine dehydrogenase FAD-binding subunit